MTVFKARERDLLERLATAVSQSMAAGVSLNDALNEVSQKARTFSNPLYDKSYFESQQDMPSIRVFVEK